MWPLPSHSPGLSPQGQLKCLEGEPGHSSAFAKSSCHDSSVLTKCHKGPVEGVTPSGTADRSRVEGVTQVAQGWGPGSRNEVIGT